MSEPNTAPAETLETVIKALALRDAKHTGPDGRAYVALPNEFSLHELKDQAFVAPYISQNIVIDDRASLSAYANRFKDERSIILADYDALTVTAQLDWHSHNQSTDAGSASPNKHRAVLRLRPSEEFARWDKFVKEGFHDQESFARFLEENASDVAEPDPATLIEISRDFEATVGQVYKSSTRLDNGDRKLVFDTESRATNDVVIPQQITLSMPFYNGEDPSEIVAKFRWRPSNGAVVFALEWHRVEYHRRAHFNQIAYLAADETGLPVFVGRTA